MKTTLTHTLPQSDVKHRAISRRSAAITACAAAVLVAAFFVPAVVLVVGLACALPLVLGIG